MERKISTKKYLLAFMLTLIIFAGGILLGIMLENIRLSHSNQVIIAERINLRSLQLQQKYIESGQADCKALNKVLEADIDELNKKMAEVIEYERKSFFNQGDFNLLLQDYFLTEIQFLQVSREIDKKCPRNNIKIIYFYDENKEETQGIILDYLKKLFGSRLLIFSLDSTFRQEPMINILLTSYKIEKFPTTVIENKVLQGHKSVEELKEIICAEFADMDAELPGECSLQSTERK
ncbi:MAG: hypothetical protein AB1668_01975 [Nanoarchaeota archaeon]